MIIEKDRVVTLAYTLRDKSGRILEQADSTAPVVYLHGHNNWLAEVENQLQNCVAGDTKTIELTPEQAYGKRYQQAVQKVPIKHLVNAPKQLPAGAIVRVNTKNGTKDATVVKAGKFMVTLDTNHPFAGMDLHFSVTILSVREAAEDEIAHGHVHGPGGHQH